MKTFSGHIVDVVSKKITDGVITIENGKITSIQPSEIVDDQYILPGLVDAHIHIESSMMLPSEFARLSAPHGTVACVSDPHEIANVCGVKGVEYMIENGKKSPMKFYFAAPSCVPATGFETSGAILDACEIEKLMQNPDILYLGEMMNFPGVLYDDEQVLLKLKAAKDNGKPIDGHAPDLSGDGLKKYVTSGISTDHECMSISEAEEKISLGMKIIIREGSAAKNFDSLIPLIEKCTLDEKIRIGSLLDKKCGGGQISHINLEGQFANEEQSWDLLNYIAKSGVIYFAYNLRISVCENEHGFFGDICPVCGNPKEDTYQRIVGYLTPSKSYSKERKLEFDNRKWFDLNES